MLAYATAVRAWPAASRVLFSVAVTLATTACGAGALSRAVSSDSTFSGPVTRAAYIGMADDICRRTQARLDENDARSRHTLQEAATKGVRSGEDLHDLQEAAALGALSELRRQGAELRQLPAPAGDEAVIAALLDEGDRARARFEADLVRAHSGYDPFEFAEFNRLAEEYGMTACARTSSVGPAPPPDARAPAAGESSPEDCKVDTRTLRTAEEAYFARHGQYAPVARLVEDGLLSEPSTLHDVVVGGISGYSLFVIDDACGTVGHAVGETPEDL